MSPRFLLLLLLFCVQHLAAQKSAGSQAQEIPVNYNEDSVGSYTLPALLRLNNGEAVGNAAEWMDKRRPELLALYQQYQFGRVPGKPGSLRFDLFEKGTPVLDGKAIRRQVTIYYSSDTRYKTELLLYLPVRTEKPAPLLLHIGFTANCNMVNDPGIKDGFVWNKEEQQIPAPRSSRSQLNIEPFIEAGFGVALVYFGDIEPDFVTGYKQGIRGVYQQPGQNGFAADDWGAIAAWAWGLSRVMDYLETDVQADAKRVALFGVSRLGKTVLCAGAYDTRFAMVIANCSGEGGAALSRRNYGETLKLLSHPSRFAHQFCKNYQLYGDSVDRFPVDAHMLISLMAPRPLLLETGDTDYWADPRGEFLAAREATPVYHLFGKKGMEQKEMPPAGQPVYHELGFFLHPGGHGTVPADWETALQFMKKFL